jgi:2-oxo-4-hydroxy-4-carboxy-5-ureidoimidazoline decarboxylase
MAEKITVQQLLSQSPDAVSKALDRIYEHSPWVLKPLIQKLDLSSMITTVSQLAAAMKAIVQDWTKEQKVALLCAYPDLCETVEKLKELTKESQEEQGKAGLQSMEGDELEKFTRLNSSYREKFNFPFILAVRNATKYTVLSALEGRLPNPPEKEFATALEQVHKIAWMRLLSLIDTDDAPGFLTCHVFDTANDCPGKFDYMSPCESVSLQFSNSIIFSCQDEDPSHSVVAHGIGWTCWRIYYK